MTTAEGDRHNQPKREDQPLRDFASNDRGGLASEIARLASLVDRLRSENEELVEQLRRSEGSLQELQSRGPVEPRGPFDGYLGAVQKSAGTGALARALAHNFNNQLTVILGNCALAQADLDSHSPLHKRLDRVRKAAQQSAALTEQLLNFASPQPALPRSVHLPHLVKAMSELLHAVAGRHCELVIEAPSAVPLLKANESQIQQLILNLVTNASEALDGQQGHGWIRIGVEHADRRDLAESIGSPDLPEGLYVVLEVEDDGPGIRQQDHAHLFEPFFTTKPRALGLGLAAALEIVRAYNGAITLESSPGEGTKVRVLLPPSGSVTETNAR